MRNCIVSQNPEGMSDVNVVVLNRVKLGNMFPIGVVDPIPRSCNPNDITGKFVVELADCPFMSF